MTSDLEERIADWHEARFGHRGIDWHRIVLKLMEEHGELGEAIRDKSNIAEEAADVAILLTHICRGVGTTLAAEMEKKLATLWERLKSKSTKTKTA
jgi:NTP pyrophosphatase (non-canonical NTP hydrolase)